MSRALIAMLAIAGWGCAVDVSGLGPPRADGGTGMDDFGPIGVDARPVDSFIPGTDAQPVDSFVPPPDMCSPSAEICNGMDDDCNGIIDDGLSSGPCDGDADGCMDGLSGCSGGSPTCTDAAPTAGMACDGPDPDTVADGRLSCMGDVLVCEGDCVEMAETCDRTDQNCNGIIDDDGACDVDDVSCSSRQNAGRVYQFCTVAGGGYSYGEALSYCEDRGYDLVRIADPAEHAFLAMHIGGMSWWSRARILSNNPNDRRDKWRWRWSTTDEIDGDPWGGGEPSGNGSCGQLRSSDGLLDDRDCDDEIGFVCEAGAL